MGVNGEALQLHTIYKKVVFFTASHTKSVSVLQVTWEFVSSNASHVHCVWACNEIKGLYDKIIITIIPRYTRNHSFVAIGLITIQTTLVIFSGIALWGIFNTISLLPSVLLQVCSTIQKQVIHIPVQLPTMVLSHKPLISMHTQMQHVTCSTWYRFIPDLQYKIQLFLNCVQL